MIKQSILTGLNFGITSGVITTLGMMIGLNAATTSKAIIISGILTIAIADSFSDALGVHISQEGEEGKTKKDVWRSTFSTFFSKMLFSLTFLIPIMFFDLSFAIICNLIWGFLLLIFLSYFIAKRQKESPFGVIGEHIAIAILVIYLTNLAGGWIQKIV